MPSFQYLWWIFTIPLESFCQWSSHLKFWDICYLIALLFYTSTTKRWFTSSAKTLCKDPLLLQLMRCLMVSPQTHNIHFQAKHIKAVNNIAADLLSRFSVSLHGSGLHPCEPSINKSLSQISEYLLYTSSSPSTVAAYKSAFQSYKLFVSQTYG